MNYLLFKHSGPADSDSGPANLDSCPADSDVGPADSDSGPADSDAEDQNFSRFILANFFLRFRHIFGTFSLHLQYNLIIFRHMFVKFLLPYLLHFQYIFVTISVKYSKKL